MLKHRIIPIILFDGTYCVQTTQFKQPARRIGPITQYVNNMANRNVDELVIIDINATKEKRRPYFDKIKEFTDNQFCPVAYGGGISSIEDIGRLIKECGVDKIIVKTKFSLINTASRKFGSQAIVYAADVKNNVVDGIPRRLNIDRWLNIIQLEGAGEILLTDTVANGQMTGYNYKLITETVENLTIPVIANGGCGEPSHMIEAIKCGASAAAASSMFALRSVTPQDCARALQEAGLPARVSGAVAPQTASQQPA